MPRPPAGYLFAFGRSDVDRTDRKTLFVVTQTAFLLMALFLGVMDYLGTIHVWHVLAISPAGFGSSIILFAASHHFFLSLFFLFVAGGFQTTFLSSVATLLQIQSAETNRGRMMSLFGLINRGLGPIGNFPFGLIAAAIGASWTVAICGFITVGLIAYITFSRLDLRNAKPIGEV